ALVPRERANDGSCCHVDDPNVSGIPRDDELALVGRWRDGAHRFLEGIGPRVFTAARVDRADLRARRCGLDEDHHVLRLEKRDRGYPMRFGTDTPRHLEGVGPIDPERSFAPHREPRSGRVERERVDAAALAESLLELAGRDVPDVELLPGAR